MAEQAELIILEELNSDFEDTCNELADRIRNGMTSVANSSQSQTTEASGIYNLACLLFN